MTKEILNIFSSSEKSEKATPMIKISGVSKSFGKKKILKNLDLEINKGESLVIIGASGTGKSVTLKCILGLLTPEKGSILVNGIESVGANAKTREQINSKIGMLFQGAALFDSMTVWENVAFGLMQGQKINKKVAKRIAKTKLAQVGLAPEVADMYPADLSGGMKKRVGLARAIATNPDIIFFDEPTTGLDPIMSDVINNLIIDSVKKIGATALTITHDMTSARKIADRIAMLYEGEIIWIGSVKEIDKTKNPYVQQFIHGSAQGPIQMAVKGE